MTYIYTNDNISNKVQNVSFVNNNPETVKDNVSMAVQYIDKIAKHYIFYNTKSFNNFIDAEVNKSLLTLTHFKDALRPLAKNDNNGAYNTYNAYMGFFPIESLIVMYQLDEQEVLDENKIKEVIEILKDDKENIIYVTREYFNEISDNAKQALKFI